MFIEQVEEQLRKMSEADKDRWILAQAKLLDESERQGFLFRTEEDYIHAR